MGLPTTTSESLTVPSGLMKTFNFTTPPMPLLFRMYGYPTGAFLSSLRMLLSCAIPGAALKSTIAHRQNVPREFLNGCELAMFFPCELGWCEAWRGNTPDRTTMSVHTLQVLAQSGGTLALIFHASNGSSCRFNALIPGSLLVALKPACFPPPEFSSRLSRPSQHLVTD